MAAYIICDGKTRDYLLNSSSLPLDNIKEILRGKVPYAIAVSEEDVIKLDSNLDTIVDGKLKTGESPIPPDCKAGI